MQIKHCTVPQKMDPAAKDSKLKTKTKEYDADKKKKKDRAYKVDNKEAIAMTEEKISNLVKSMSLDKDASSSLTCPTEPGAAVGPEHLKPEKLVAHMIALGGCDPSIVDNEHFKSLMSIHWPSSSQVPSRVSIEEMCDAIFKQARSTVWDSWHRMEPKPRISLAVGRAKTMDREILYTACQFIDQKWELHKVVLDAYVLVPHLRHHGILSDVTELYTGSGTEYMIGEVPIGTSLPGVDLLGRLFMMAWGTAPPSYDESGPYRHRHEMEAQEQHSEEMKMQLGKVFPDTFPVKMELLSVRFIDQVLEAAAQCLQYVFLGFRKSISEELLGLRLTRQVRQQLHSKLSLEPLSTYDNNWYRTYCALKILKDSKSALIDEDKKLAGLLIKVFGEVYHSIQAISDPIYPTASLCLPELFKIRNVLERELAQNKGDNPNVYDISADVVPKPQNITKCLRDAKETLDHAIEDSYLLWSVPLVLDPRYKLQRTSSVFQRAYGSKKADGMTSKVLRKLKNLYRNYIPVPLPAGGAIPMDIDSASQSEQANTTELDDYLQAPLISFKGKEIKDANVPSKEGHDILDWWKKNEKNYPVVAQMARDALAMATCSRISSAQMVQVRNLVRGYSKKPLDSRHIEKEADAAIAPAEDEEAQASLIEEGKAAAAEEEEAEAAAYVAVEASLIQETAAAAAAYVAVEAAGDETEPVLAAAAAEAAAAAAEALAEAVPAYRRAKVKARAEAAKKAAATAAVIAEAINAPEKAPTLATTAAAEAAVQTMQAALEASPQAFFFGRDEKKKDKKKKRRISATKKI